MKPSTSILLSTSALVLLCSLLARPASAAKGEGPHSAQSDSARLSEDVLGRGFEPNVKPLDLSRAPTTDEPMSAGQLSGALFPTHELKDKY